MDVWWQAWFIDQSSRETDNVNALREKLESAVQLDQITQEEQRAWFTQVGNVLIEESVRYEP